MKPILIFVITFVVGTAAATGAKVMTAKPVAGAHGDSANADSTQADSTHAGASAASHEGPHGDTAVIASGQPVHAPADTMPRPVANASQGSAKPDAGKQAASSATAAATATPPDTASERRLAKVFTAMEPKQAAKVLQHMSDGDVQIILGYVGPRQAASIMSELPPERVAKLSKLALSGGLSK